MRILQLTNKFPYPPIDGGSIATLSLSRSFARIGAEVSILAMNTKKHYFPPEKLPDDLKNEIKFHTVDIDTQIRILPLLINLIFSRRPYNAQRFIDKEYNQSQHPLKLLSQAVYIPWIPAFFCPGRLSELPHPYHSGTSAPSI